MPYKLYILLEGDDDERFFENVIQPLLQSRYQTITLVKYANDSPRTRRRLIMSFRALNADYIYTTDINNQPCVTAKKQQVIRELGCPLNEDNIIVVIKEIESWYLAGLDQSILRKYEIPPITSTDNITKEQFNRLVPKRMSRIDFMQEILGTYEAEIARNKNQSFRYFLNKRCSCCS